MRVHVCIPVLLVTTAPFAATPASAQSTAQVCSETATVLADLKAQRAEVDAMRWTGSIHHGAVIDLPGGHKDLEEVDNTDWVNELRLAIEGNRVVGDFTQISEGLNMAAEAPSLGLPWPPNEPADKLVWQRAMLAKFTRLSGEASRMSHDELSLRWERLQNQIELREQRLADLSCGNLPTTATSSANAALPLARSERLQQDRRQSYNAVIYQEYRYSDNSAELIVQNDPPDRRQVRWTFDGIPGSLNPGDQVTIAIAGQFNFQPPGSEMGANYSAGVRVEGLDQGSAQNAYAYQGQTGQGLFKYTVPMNATKVVIEIGADNGLGVFQRY